MSTLATTPLSNAPAETTETVHPEAPDAAEGGEAQQAAPAPRRLKLKGLEGEDEREYEESMVVGLARRGREAARLLSLAEKRSKEADEKVRAAEEKLSRLKGKDVRTIRAALRELDVDVAKLAEEEVLERVEESRLTPEQKRIRELEREKATREEADTKAKQTEAEKAHAADVERYQEELSQEFVHAATLAGLPPEAAPHVFPRFARLYEAAERAGTKVDPALAAEHMRAGLMAEHGALLRTKEGKLNFQAIESIFGPEDWKAIRQYGVELHRKGKAAPAQPAAPVGPTKTPTNGTGGKVKVGSPEWWRRIGS